MFTEPIKLFNILEYQETYYMGRNWNVSCSQDGEVVKWL